MRLQIYFIVISNRISSCFDRRVGPYSPIAIVAKAMSVLLAILNMMDTGDQL